MRLFFLSLFGILSLPLSAQDDLMRDSAFFHAQKETYQRWLEHEGLAEDLRVEDVLVTEHHVFLYLGFYTTDVDTVTEIWTPLQEAFRENGPITLEQHLFYKMVQLMELEEDQARVVLFENYDVEEAPEPCFIRGIVFEDGQVGTGYFGSIGRGAYYDMEIDFDEYLEEYADRFKLELQDLF